MSTREIAYSIFNRLSEKQLEGFIAMFGEIYSPQANDIGITESEKNKGMAAFKKLQGMIKEVPDLDYYKELSEYREEKYGL